MRNNIPSQERVIVIGSGIGGLSSAIILAKLGFDVTVLEKNREPGGLMRSYNREGISCSVGVHYLGSLDRGQILRKFFDYLGVSDAVPVTRMGTSGIVDKYVFNSPATHPETFDLPGGVDGYEQNLKTAFPAESDTIEKLLTQVRVASEQLHGLDYLYGDNNDFSLLDECQPLGEILDELQCSPGLRSVLAIPSCWIGVPLQECPAFYHNMALASYISSSWRLLGDGTDMANAFVDRLQELGGKIITGVEVSKIEVDARVVKGVEITGGEKLAATKVIGAVHPKIVLQMLSPGDVKPSYRKRISGLTDTHGIFSAHIRVDERDHPEIPYNIFNVDTFKDGNVSDIKYYQIRKSGKSGFNLLSILTSGKEELWEPWSDTASRCRGSEYLELKQRHAEGLLKEAEELFGPFNNAKVLDVYTPLTIRDWVNSPDGSAYGVLRSSKQMLAAAMLNRTAIKGLYLAGQSVLAPGIIGSIMGSFSTVKLILGPEEFSSLIDLK